MSTVDLVIAGPAGTGERTTPADHTDRRVVDGYRTTTEVRG